MNNYEPNVQLTEARNKKSASKGGRSIAGAV